MTEAIIFDFDGTLADTTDAIVTTLQLSMRQLNLPDADTATAKSLIGLPLVECIRTITGYTDEAEIKRATDLYRSIWPEVNTTASHLFPRVAETLHALKDRGLTLAIATSRSRASVLQMIDSFGIADLITTVRADEDVINKKPAPDMVLSILNELGVAPENAVTVGDTTFDINMGAKAGTGTIGVSYGNHTREQLATARPDHIIDDFAEINYLI